MRSVAPGVRSFALGVGVLHQPDVAVPKRAGLLTAVDIVIAPEAAFARLRLVSTWGWAFLIAMVLGIIGAFLLSPAVTHAMTVSGPETLAKSPQIMNLPPERQQAAIEQGTAIQLIIAKFLWVGIPIILLLASLCQALIMLIANAIMRGQGSFGKFFALSMNVAVVGTGIAGLLAGIIATVRGAASFQDMTAISATLPSLALLAPGSHGFMHGFLATLNVGYIWATVLLALGMAAVARVSRAGAWTTAVLMLVLFALYSGFNARAL